MGPSKNKCQSEEHRLTVLGREVHGHRAESRPGDMQVSIPSQCCQRRSGVVRGGGGHRGFLEVEADTGCSNLFFLFLIRILFARFILPSYQYHEI